MILTAAAARGSGRDRGSGSLEAFPITASTAKAEQEGGLRAKGCLPQQLIAMFKKGRENSIVITGGKGSVCI